MSQNSAIEWTEATWNPVRGCTKVSPGCANCYAETFAERFRGVKGHPYEQGFDLRLVPEKLGDPVHRKKSTTYFVNSMSDLFQEDVPDDYIAEVWKVMHRTPRHTYQVLTRRAARLPVILPRLVATFGVLPNVWLGVSVENQHFADERIPLLLKTPAAVRFISAEPLLERINLDDGESSWLTCTSKLTADEYEAMTSAQRREIDEVVGDCCESWVDHGAHFHGLDWVIVGGESGHGARPFEVAWARSIIHQCKAAGVPVFVKQLGARPVFPDGGGWEWKPTSRKGGDPAEWPEDLRVREMPTVTR